jgi:CO dehydrogenase maturation factor
MERGSWMKDGMKIIIVVGRGGTGKTSFTALATKYLIEIGHRPILLIDADPDQNLGELVGIDFSQEGKRTLSELVAETFVQGGGTLTGIPPSERMESKIWENGLFEGENFDLMSIGEKWVEGCYCLPNAALKGALESLTKTYSAVIIDSPAGLEHLNRRISSRVDDIFDLLDPSSKSFNHVKRAHRIVKEVKIDFKNFYIVGGYRFPEDLEPEVEKRTGLRYLGRIAFDKNVEQCVLKGESLLELPSTSLAYNSVKKILERAGYSG